MGGNLILFGSFSSAERDIRIVVEAIVAVNKSISGTVSWPTILTMTARASSWIGSCSPRAAFVGAIREKETKIEGRKVR